MTHLPRFNAVFHAMSVIIDRQVFPPQPSVSERQRREKVQRVSYETFSYLMGAREMPDPQALLGAAQPQRVSFKPNDDLLKTLDLPLNSQPSVETLLKHALKKYPFEVYEGLENWKYPQRISCTALQNMIKVDYY